jgi:SAM-dependent methyltransferase
MKVEIGSGWHPTPGYDVHLDREAYPHVEVIADAAHLPFRDETVERILSIHCLEHVEYWDIAATLAEWMRVLKKDGVIEIHVPNAEAACRAYLDTPDPARRREIGRFLFGDANLPPEQRGSRHVAMLDPLLVSNFAGEAGLRVMWVGDSHDRHDGWKALIAGAGLCALLVRADGGPPTMDLDCLQDSDDPIK